MHYQLIYFCQNIKHLRETGGYSYAETAKALHTSVKTLKSIESGIVPSRVSMRIIWYAADFFGVPAPSLLLPQENSGTIYL